MIYTVEIKVQVIAHTEKYAYQVIKHALNNARLAEITIGDMEVIEIEKEAEEDEPKLPLE